MGTGELMGPTAGRTNAEDLRQRGDHERMRAEWQRQREQYLADAPRREIALARAWFVAELFATEADAIAYRDFRGDGFVVPRKVYAPA
jgi:hypothetical protein